VLRSTLSLASNLHKDLKDAPPLLVSTKDWALTSKELQDAEVGSDEEERTPLGHAYERKIMFRILHGNTLVMASDNAPPINEFLREPGYQRIHFDNHDWFIFVMLDDDLLYLVGERSDVRKEIISKIALSYLYPTLLTLPLLLLLLGWILQRGLSPLAALEQSIAERDKDNLDPIPTEKTPKEITPIVAALNGLLTRLRRSLESERRFTSTASHEMRTPIAVLKLNVQNALNAKDESERLALLRELDVNVDRAGRLINQLLALSRLDQDGPAFAIQTIDILPVLREEIAGLYTLAMEQEKNVELLTSAEHLMLPCMPQLLSLLVRNLIDNAIKYSPPGGRVLISAEQRDGNILLQVEDNGPGVPAEEREKIFERFYRITNAEVQGSGLGLAIVKRTLEVMGGSLELGSSDSLGGLSVRVTLPCAVN